MLQLLLLAGAHASARFRIPHGSPCASLRDLTQQRCCMIYLTNPSMQIGRRWGSVVGGQRDQWQRFECDKFKAVLVRERGLLRRAPKLHRAHATHAAAAASNAVAAVASGGSDSPVRRRRAPTPPPTPELPLLHSGSAPADDDDPHLGHDARRHRRSAAAGAAAVGAESALRRAVSAAGGPAKFMSTYRTHLHNGVRGWLPWGPTNAAPLLTRRDLRCPVQLHRHCKLHSAAACSRCAEKLVAKGALLRTDCHIGKVCELLSKSAGVRASRVHQRYIDAQLRSPQQQQQQQQQQQRGVPASKMHVAFQTAVGGCLLTEAEHLLDLFRALAECPHYFSWQGTQCYTRDAADFAQRIRSCCMVGDGSMGDIKLQLSGAIMCRRLTRPVLAAVQKKLLPRYAACAADPAKCLALHRDFYLCRLGDDGRCVSALTGHSGGGVNFMQIFKQMSFVAQMMYATHHKDLSRRAVLLLSLCRGGAHSDACGRAVSDIFFEGKDSRLGDPHFD
jgi:hypothetical protein